MKAALTFACLNIKKTAKLFDKSEDNGGEFSQFTKIFTILFEKLIYFRINIKKASINLFY